jgi:hypothetical protein
VLLTPEGILSSFGIGGGDFTLEGVLSSFGGAGEFALAFAPLGLRSSFGICFFASELVRWVAGFSAGILVELVFCAVERLNVGREGMLVGIDGRYDDARAVYDCVSGFLLLVA